jgi:hypothetical protein
VTAPRAAGKWNDPDRLVAIARVLGGEGVDAVLMDEARIAVRQRVGAQLVVGVLHGRVDPAVRSAAFRAV